MNEDDRSNWLLKYAIDDDNVKGLDNLVFYSLQGELVRVGWRKDTDIWAAQDGHASESGRVSHFELRFRTTGREIKLLE